MSRSADNVPPLDADRLIADLVSCRALNGKQATTTLHQYQINHPQSGVIGLAEFLVSRRLVTAYQAERALVGNTAALSCGPYLLHDLLNNGPFGTLYQAVRPSDQRVYTIHRLPGGEWRTDRVKEIWSAVTSRPLHPAVVPLTDVDTNGDGTYLVWPFIDGECLEDSVIRVGPLPVFDAVRVFAELCDALADCHDRGIAHGCIRPASILLGTDRSPHLTNIGLGALLEENPALAETSGTGISPDRSWGRVTGPDRLADSRSLGCALYFALTGSLPIDASAKDHQPSTTPSVKLRNPAVPVPLAGIVDKLVSDGSTELRQVAVELRTLLLSSEVELENEFSASSPGEPDTKTDCPSWAMTIPNTRVESRTDVESALELSHDTPCPTEEQRWGRNRSATEPSAVLLVPAPRTPISLPPSTPRIAQISLPADHQYASSSPVLLKVQDQGALTDSQLQRSLPSPVDVRSNTAEAQVDWTLPEVVIPPPPHFARSSGRSARSLLFWKGIRDAVMISVFGPPTVTPGQQTQLFVYANLSDTFAGVSTLCRALHSEVDLIGVAYIDCPVLHQSNVGLHVAVANAGVGKSLTEFTWIGQTQSRTYELFVPWESPPGLTSGTVSVDIEGTRAGIIPFQFVVLPRSS